MHRIMAQLETDHRNVALLLGMLDAQLDAVHDPEAMADFELLCDIMLYMTHYSDKSHHPLEDLVFGRLVRRNPDSGQVVRTITQEHADLAEKGESFKTALKHVVDGEMALRTEIETQGRDYSEFLRRHMVFENEHVFPLARDLLHDADWSAVEAESDAEEDPVFGPVVKEDYRVLFDLIKERAG